MKYGEQLERESAPQWSLHNLDYNSLKHEIKMHTTRDQATAMVIPGYEDPALAKFENALFAELCRQHDRVDLFVSSKADEILRRMQHLQANTHRWIQKYDEEPPCRNLAMKRQRRLAKYERGLLHCGDDIYALERFCKAQVTAFRKILKKYKKWTGSTTLHARFNDQVLSSLKSFTRRDFAPLRERHSEILADLRNAAPALSEPSSPSSVELPPSPVSSATRVSRVSFDPLPPAAAAPAPPQHKYWNEYDDGSDAGDEGYAIYINPDEDSTFPGMGYVNAIVTMPYEKIRAWFKLRDKRERHPLLSDDRSACGGGYSSAGHADSDEEAGYSSSDGIPTEGYSMHYATFPSINEQQIRQYRERVLFWGTIASFTAAYILMGVAAILISTGKRKLRVEVDVGVSVGVMVSLFCSCAGLGMTLYRRETPALMTRLAVWLSFTASCLINGMLLILVVGNTP
ncbi:SPX domain containing protein [Cordyceps fumosorosea ARSEF 2679]|uniref:SPX domain containing protein n=1 Tax=Cordyceps fumosorosea (strain ARSEF 2679) TaxID=1081104 RepID=A0A167NDE7_CORFA|nr:SPX domain containing protein [Cordyceps fumosorosea ARSEF 2679]OAA55428.1 SPX domain containing protein [Cordyceps fumosorosea ARSEF 2679]